MIVLGAIGDLAFVAAAYGVILGGTGVYAISLSRRLRRAGQSSASPATQDPRPAEPPTDHRA